MKERAERGTSRAWPMADRSVLATVLGLETWAAVGVAAGLTALGVCVDLLRVGTLGPIFTVCYVAGCLLAVAWVRREGLFWPVVLPPLLVAVAVPAVVLLAGTPRPGTGMAERLLVIAAPLVNAFPIMAWTCGVVLLAGLIRVFTQRLGRPRSGTGTSTTGEQQRPVSSRRGRAADAAPEAARTSESPQRS
jgi:uncharacterized protein DUF6542